MSQRRERLTKGNNRTASPPPSIPEEEGGYQHPAAQEDPAADKYFVGKNEPSQWAEDPTKGPYPNSPHPATPTEPGGYNHPAGDPANLRVAAAKKAAKCIRVAEFLLAPSLQDMGEEQTTPIIEDRALSFMNWPERQLVGALQTISKAAMWMDDEQEDATDFTQDEDWALLEEGRGLYANKDPQKSASETAEPQRELTAEDHMLALMLHEEREREACGDEYMDDMDNMEDEEEAMLRAMLMEEDSMDDGHYMDEEEAMLDEMLMEDMGHYASSNEPKAASETKAAKKGDDEEDEDKDDKKDDTDDGKDDTDEDADDKDDKDDKEDGKKASELDIVMDSVDDPMGLSGDVEAPNELSDLYARFASDEEEEEEEEEKEGKSKKASGSPKLRPRPKKPSQGPASLGGTPKKASDGDDLSLLWDSAPDVSEIFGNLS